MAIFYFDRIRDAREPSRIRCRSPSVHGVSGTASPSRSSWSRWGLVLPLGPREGLRKRATTGGRGRGRGSGAWLG